MTNGIKNTLAFFTAGTMISILVLSCYKPKKYTPPNVPASFYVSINNIDYIDLSYTADTIKDSIAVEAQFDSTLSLGLSFKATSGNPAYETITCYVSDLPAGIAVQKDSVSFKLDFVADFIFSIKEPPGTYPFKVNVFAPSRGLRTYPASISVH